ncbi:MAG: hypothetical protein HY876_09800 [Coriobacteriales bacterium]|nr:hypothetical protein [Coriobacteriales bacterium]
MTRKQAEGDLGGSNSSRAEAELDSAADVEVLRDEIERLKAENEALKSEAQPIETRTAGRTRAWRWVAMALLVVLGSVVAFGAVSAFWVNRFIMDTDTFVTTLQPLARDPRVKAAVVNGVDEAIFSAFPIEDRVTSLLAGIQDLLEQRGIDVRSVPAEALAGPITAQIHNLIRQQTTNMLDSAEFQTLFDRALREGHQAFLAAMNRTQTATEAGLVSFQGDTIYLDVNLFANEVKDRLVANGLTFLQNVSLDRVRGQVKLVESPLIVQGLAVIQVLNTLAWLLPLLALALLTGAVFAAPDRRRGLLFVGVGLATVAFLGLLALNIGHAGVTALASGSGGTSSALVAIYEIVPRGLVTLLRLLFALSLVLVLGAVLTGPARWAVTTRTWIADLVSGTGTGTRVAGFIEKWRTPLAGAGVILGIVAVVALPVSAAGAFWIAVAVLVWVFAIETIGRGGRPAGPTPARTA